MSRASYLALDEKTPGLARLRAERSRAGQTRPPETLEGTSVPLLRAIADRLMSPPPHPRSACHGRAARSPTTARSPRVWAITRFRVITQPPQKDMLATHPRCWPRPTGGPREVLANPAGPVRQWRRLGKGSLREQAGAAEERSP
jgi:hypothetical protein